MNMKSAPFKKLATMTIAISAVCAGAWRAEAATYVQTDLVSDTPGLATITDPELMNPWGISDSGTSPFWISDQATNVATLYTVTGSTNVSKVEINPPTGFVAIPTTASGPQGPTGQVNNSNTTSFLVGNGGNGTFAHFIFANLNGTISAWDTGTTAFVQATTPGASYTGLAISQNLTQPVLYAANNAAGTIDVFNSAFTKVTSPGAFIDPNLPAGLVPFNVQDINGKVYVTYAPSNPATAIAGQGVVDVFNENGNLIQRVASGGSLAAPWGVALAPASFGQFGGDLLVGNFSTNSVSAFDPTIFAFLGTIAIDGPGGLLALEFGNGASGGSPNTLYFTDESDGLFGAIAPTTPLPAALPLFATGLGALGLLGWRRKQKNVAAIAAV